ncbi:MAG: VWA domain-containing protein, partial [Lentisphaeria bacterium]|nr:VWA domain-containing protein [Lentisphaeria bacterium]
MNFNDPHWFWWLIPVVLLVLILAALAGKRKKAQLKMLLGAAADDPDAVRLSKGIRKFRLFLLLLTVFFLIAAAARPYWTSRMIPFSQQGRDIMVLFDVSKSMLASDIAPTRLDHARFMLRELVKSDPLDRFGLVAFAGTAYTVCPLTSDPVAFEQYIDELNPDLVPVGGTNLEQALKAATRAFKAAGGSNRAIVLFTDGDELEGDSKRIFAELKKRNTPLFIVGLGDPQAGAPVPDGKGGFQRDEAGKLITTKLAEKKLIQAAEATGGIYIGSTVTDTGIRTLEKRIRKLDLAERESSIRTIPFEKFPLALICAAVFLFCYLVVSERPRTKKMFVFAMFALLLCGAAENPVSKENVPQVSVTEKLPENVDALYNLARKRQ